MTSFARLAIALSASIAAALAPPAPAAPATKLPVAFDVVAVPLSVPGGDVEYVAKRAGPGTVVEASERGSGELLRAARLPGEYAVPAVAYDGSASGLSADGRTLVLTSPRKRFPRASTTFVVLDTERLRLRRVLRLEGDFSFDALSPDGSLMYLINYVSPRDQTRYRVRVYDLRTRRLLPKPVVDPSEPPDEMSGMPITRATSPDGRWAYTLYDGTEHPFIHALDTERRRAVCIDLDSLGADPNRGLFDLRLDLPRDGSPLAVVSGARVLANVDTRTFRASEPGANSHGAGAARRPQQNDGGAVPWLALAAGSAAVALAALLRVGVNGGGVGWQLPRRAGLPRSVPSPARRPQSRSNPLPRRRASTLSARSRPTRQSARNGPPWARTAEAGGGADPPLVR